MGQIKFITSIVLIALFGIAVVTFVINFGYDNNSKINLANDPDFVKMNSEVSSNVSAYYKDIQIVTNATQQSTISSQTEATEGGTAFKVGPTTALAMASSTITVGFKKVFGSDSGFQILFTALIAVLGFIAAMYIYKAWAGRDPD
jgi:preprotein translocase subunit SecF